MAARPSMLECEIWKRRHLDLRSCFVLLTDAIDGDIKSREEDQGQHRRDGEPADDGIGIGPQNTSCMIGIMPRIAAAAVSMIGRNL